MKSLIENLRKTNPDVDHHIFTALTNVNMNCIIGYHIELRLFYIYNDNLFFDFYLSFFLNDNCFIYKFI